MTSQLSLFASEPGLKQSTVYRGGFPCQPHSIAGKRRASGDERDLWPEMRRVVGEIKPEWVVAENVRGLLSSESGRFFRGILRDFADMGYSVGWGITSAAAVGACHRRERMAIVAHADSKRYSRHERLQKNNIPIEPGQTSVHGTASEFYYGFDWWEARARKSGFLGANDGVPSRVDRIKCLGNAVVPQQFYPVFKAIAEMENVK